ncbi:hypothetical protein [Peribacillus loiseleuriae]
MNTTLSTFMSIVFTVIIILSLFIGVVFSTLEKKDNKYLNNLQQYQIEEK